MKYLCMPENAVIALFAPKATASGAPPTRIWLKCSEDSRWVAPPLTTDTWWSPVVMLPQRVVFPQASPGVKCHSGLA